MLDSDFMRKATYQDAAGKIDWRAFLVYADSLEEEGREIESLFWRWVGENHKRPIQLGKSFQWFFAKLDCPYPDLEEHCLPLNIGMYFTAGQCEKLEAECFFTTIYNTENTAMDDLFQAWIKWRNKK